MGLAFFNLDSMELVIIVVVALLLFGERLPEVAKSVGRGVMEFRKSLLELRSQSGIDDAIRKFKDEIQVPDGVRNPGRFLEDSVRQTITEETEPAPETPAEMPATGMPASPSGEPLAEGDCPPGLGPHVVIDPPPVLSPFEAALRKEPEEGSGPSPT